MFLVKCERVFDVIVLEVNLVEKFENFWVICFVWKLKLGVLSILVMKIFWVLFNSWGFFGLGCNFILIVCVLKLIILDLDVKFLFVFK